MKRAVFITSVFLTTTTLLYAQQRSRREHLICPIDGGRMDATGQQKGGLYDASCEFSHVVYPDGKRTEHKAWASCTEIR
jgi:hypothetical protein